MQLHFESFPTESGSDDAIIIVPGLFGSTTNWRRFATELSNWRSVVVVDQRNHGKSPHADSQTYADMVEDLLCLIEDQSLGQPVVVGHSLGGKVAMLLALHHPQVVRRLVVLDIAPIAYADNHTATLDALLSLDLDRLHSRAEAGQLLEPVISDQATRMFLLQNLRGKPGQYRWQLNLEVLRAHMHELTGFPESSVEGHKFDGAGLFVSGQQSDYLRAEHHELIQRWFPSAEFAMIADAGHWLHVEQPQAVLQRLQKFLES